VSKCVRVMWAPPRFTSPSLRLRQVLPARLSSRSSPPGRPDAGQTLVSMTRSFPEADVSTATSELGRRGARSPAPAGVSRWQVVLPHHL